MCSLWSIPQVTVADSRILEWIWTKTCQECYDSQKNCVRVECSLILRGEIGGNGFVFMLKLTKWGWRLQSIQTVNMITQYKSDFWRPSRNSTNLLHQGRVSGKNWGRTHVTDLRLAFGPTGTGVQISRQTEGHKVNQRSIQIISKPFGICRTRLQ